MGQASIRIENFMHQFGQRQFPGGGCPGPNLSYVNNSIVPTTNPGLYVAVDSLPDEYLALNEQDFSNSTSSSITVNYNPGLVVFDADYTWDVSQIMQDAPNKPAHLNPIAVYTTPDGVIFAFPPPIDLDVSQFNIQHLSDRFVTNQPTSIVIPSGRTLHVSTVVVYAPVSAVINVLYRYQGNTQFQCAEGDTTSTTNNNYGIGTIMSSFSIAGVTVVDSGTIDVLCGGAFTGNLFKNFQVEYTLTDLDRPRGQKTDVGRKTKIKLALQQPKAVR